MPAKSRTERKRKRQNGSAAGAETPRAAAFDEKLDSHRTSPASALNAWWAEALVAAVTIFFGLIRIRLLNFPLERDEGEYAYAGQLILHGVVPYRYCYTMKLPGTAAAYALLTAVFGQTAAGVHLGLLLVNTATTVLLYLLARRLFGRVAGVVASAAFAFLSLEPTVLGFAGHATQFVVLPAVGGLLLLLKAVETERPSLYVGSGFVLGLAFLMKQPGLFFVLFGACYLAWQELRRGFRPRTFLHRTGLFLLGAATPFAVTCLLVWRSGMFSTFWFWTFSYGGKYGSILTLAQGWSVFWNAIAAVVSPAALLWVIAGLGIVVVLWESIARAHAVFVLGLLVFSFAAVCPGFYFREHYFVLLLPAVALLCGIAVSRTLALFQKTAQSPPVVPAIVFAIALVMSVVHESTYFFSLDPVAACRQTYGENPFPEAPRIADFLQQHSAQGDRIAVLGSEPEILFYARRLSATGYIYTYPLMEPQPFASDMQREMESEIETAAPRFLVFVDTPLSWLVRRDSDKGILKWTEQYVQGRYRLVGAVDLFGDASEFHWETELQNYKPRSKARILVFQKL